jgi:hypothetical protein
MFEYFLHNIFAAAVCCCHCRRRSRLMLLSARENDDDVDEGKQNTQKKLQNEKSDIAYRCS